MTNPANVSPDQIIRRNPDGSPWTTVRIEKGTPTLFTAIRDGTKWAVIPASEFIAMVNKQPQKAPPPQKSTPQVSDHMKLVSKQLRNCR